MSYYFKGISHHTKVIEVDGKRINLQVWDTSGQERFRSMVKSYYKNAMGVILAYSIEDRESFAQIENWMEQIIDNSDKSICIILVATKSDLPREISYEEGENLANKYKINFFETSAKNGTNIDETFYRLTAEIKKTFLDKQDTTEFKSFGLDPTKALVSKTEQEQKSCAC